MSFVDSELGVIPGPVFSSHAEDYVASFSDDTNPGSPRVYDLYIYQNERGTYYKIVDDAGRYDFCTGPIWFLFKTENRMYALAAAILIEKGVLRWVPKENRSEVV